MQIKKQNASHNKLEIIKQIQIWGFNLKLHKQ